ncbi:CrcB family protein [Neobacillus notoginsengisoli]|uniref:Fluoride-specific ion channel FluC n=1 Tax=Neobacillus notoginsengisoli TaxID=1578198 RepID=A0A417YXC5_9BACI|nr:CrcB family protein [Neobacillus notoginsengisoli]RHW42224.1 CrcB family protein [Neobacillus notoginsengisoli]
MKLVFIAAGGFLGAILRLYLSRMLNRVERFPRGTLIANLLGSFILGILASKAVNGNMYALAGIGFTGALTTFSTFMLELVQLDSARKRRTSIGYFAVSITGGMILVFTGILIGRM